MNNVIGNSTIRKVFLIAFLLPLMLSSSPVQAAQKTENVGEVSQPNPAIVGAQKINPTTVEVLLSGNRMITFDFYGDNIFRMFQDNTGGIIRDPEAQPEAQILVSRPRKPLSELNLYETDHLLTISTGKIKIELNKNTSLFTVTNLKTNSVVLEEIAPIQFEAKKVILTLKENPQEYFYGGGVQNGRFSHKGKVISIENQNSWTDGGVASPTPYYWSTNGYGVMWYTFKKGKYDFGAKEKGIVTLYHESDYLDVFFMINEGAVSLLNDFYQRHIEEFESITFYVDDGHTGTDANREDFQRILSDVMSGKVN